MEAAKCYCQQKQIEVIIDRRQGVKYNASNKCLESNFVGCAKRELDWILRSCG